MIDGLKEGQNIVLEGRLRMNSVTRKDGTKEKQPEVTISKIHHIDSIEDKNFDEKESNTAFEAEDNPQNSNWDSTPLVPDVDEIPF